MTLDIDALLKATAQEVWDEEEPSDGHLDAVWLSLAVIVPAVTAEVRALHHRYSAAFMAYDCECGDCDHEGDCPVTPTSVCIPCSAPELDHYVIWPCRTVRLLDELDKAARGERS